MAASLMNNTLLLLLVPSSMSSFIKEGDGDGSACELLIEDGLTQKDGNVEANERVFSMAMRHEHPYRVRTQRFGVTPTRYFPHSTNEGRSNDGSSLSQIINIREEANLHVDYQIWMMNTLLFLTKQ
ncbi:hypothetical protein IEQ34_014336 [Dendrobium chrysotoxum]|uniref:Uncharacterized protein n=1 Tax=Dendrobium chrysotoxum TaxID=161865 RepID=A0AAV7GL44_DENCH|nr:hypothetical protein IEQ34_014336 [Dendrobium chrysotoxum]